MCLALGQWLPRGKAVQVEHIRLTLGVKALGFNQLKVHPFQISSFRCQPAPLQRARRSLPRPRRTAQCQGKAVQARP